MLGGDPWVLPVWNAINVAAKRGARMAITPAMGGLGLTVSVKLNMLPEIVGRINEGCRFLLEKVKSRDPQHDFEEGKEGRAVEIDDALNYGLLIDIDELLFELNSCCELMGELFRLVHELGGEELGKERVGPRLRRAIKERGGDTKWFLRLDQHRNFFMHKGAPWIAVDLSEEPREYDLLIMKENPKWFHRESQFIRLSELNMIVQGFVTSKGLIQQELIDFVNRCGKAGP